jgi:hypothetical protein
MVTCLYFKILLLYLKQYTPKDDILTDTKTSATQVVTTKENEFVITRNQETNILVVKNEKRVKQTRGI